MKTIIPENITPEVAAYIKALQNENKKLQSEISGLKDKVEKQDIRITNLTEMLVNSRKKIFGKSSEQSKYLNDGQLSFFNEAEEAATPSAPEPTEKTLVAAHARKKKRTKAEITENLKVTVKRCHKKSACENILNSQVNSYILLFLNLTFLWYIPRQEHI